MASRILTAEISVILKSLRWLAAGSSPHHSWDIQPSTSHPLNWPRLIHLARQQRVLGFVAHAFKQRGLFADLEPNIRTLLSQALLETQWENRIKLNQFENFQRLFDQKKIILLPLKGIGLTYRLYHKIPFRPMGDIDVLVREEDLSAASEYLLRQGFRVMPIITKNRWHDRLGTTMAKDLSKKSSGRQSFKTNDFDIDLHWKPVYQVGGVPVEIDITSSWQRAQPHPTSTGAQILTLCDEDLAWHLILHTAEMHNSYFVQILDIALLMNQCSAQTHAILQNRISNLPDPARTILKTLVSDSQILLGPEEPSTLPSTTHSLIQYFFYHINSGIYRKIRPAEAQKIYSKTLLFSFKQIRYIVGYLLPNPEYYHSNLKKYGFAMYWKHWRDLLRKIGAALWQKISKALGGEAP